MEQELRSLFEERYSSRKEVLAGLRKKMNRNKDAAQIPEEEAMRWIHQERDQSTDWQLQR